MPRVLLSIAIIVAVAAMFLGSTIKRAGLNSYEPPVLAAGDISPRREIAIIDFQVPKTPSQLDEERRQAAANVIPVFSPEREPLLLMSAEIDSLFSVMNSFPAKNASDSLKTAVESKFSFSVSFKEIESFRSSLRYRNTNYADSLHGYLLEGINKLYSYYIVSRMDDLHYHDVKDMIMLESMGPQQTVPVSGILDVASAGDSLRTFLDQNIGKRLPSRNMKVVTSFVTKFIRPNLAYNARISGELKQQAMVAVPVNAASYKKNERIIEANVPVSEAQITALEAYRNALESQTFEENRRKHYADATGKIFISICLLAVLGSYLALYRKKIFSSFNRLLLLVIIVALPMTVAYFASWSSGVFGFMIPAAMASILVTVLFDAEMGMLISFGLALFISLLFPETGVRLGIVYCVGSGAGALSVGRVRHRKEFYRSMALTPIVLAISVLATHDWFSVMPLTDTGKYIFVAAVNGFFCPILAIGLLPVLESSFKIVTDITLLELSDLNNLLLRDTAVKAPGTFSSVLMVGALAEAAAEKIGANPLLARVGSYYHDIGKSVIPEYFIENQMGGKNPHDRLSPHMSALVLASHVKEGYELGLKYGLPQAILDIIKQHHGTSLMASIYHKAESQNEGEPVDESAFRYPGPKPQTREAGIVMLADLVEAASRSLADKSPSRLKSLIGTIIQKRFLEGELDECDLTLRDLHNIEESFLPVLVGSHHGRIAYPWQKVTKENVGGHHDILNSQDQKASSSNSKDEKSKETKA